MITVVVELANGMLTTFRSDDPDAQLLVLDLDVAAHGDEIATLRGQPDSLTEHDLDHLFTLLEPNPEELELGGEG